MIFTNPAGAPELACDERGCRWFDRMTGTCYECVTPVSPQAQAEFVRAVEVHAAKRGVALPRDGVGADGKPISSFTGTEHVTTKVHGPKN